MSISPTWTSPSRSSTTCRTAKSELPYSSIFGRWCPWRASSTARSCSPNSAAISSSSAGSGSLSATHTKASGRFTYSLIASLGMSASLRPSWYATQLTSMDPPSPVRGGVHREVAVGVAGPQPRRAARLIGHAAGEKVRGIVERLHGAKAVALDGHPGGVAAQEIHQQRGDERPVHHEPRIAFDAGRVRLVVVDAMAVEGHRGIAQEQDRIGMDLAPPRRPLPVRSRLCGKRRLAAGGDVVLVGDDEAAGIAHLVAHGHEDERPAASLLRLHVGDARDALDFRTDDERAPELDAAPGPHAPRQGDRRQGLALPPMAVGTSFGLAIGGQEIQPMRERRGGIAFARRGIVAVEQRGKRGERRRGHDVATRLGAADPLRELRELSLVVHGVATLQSPPSALINATVAARRRPSRTTVLRSSESCVACTCTTFR